MNTSRTLAAILSANILVVISAISAPSDDSWLAVEGKAGGDRSLVRSNIFAPLWADDGAMLYLDLRGVVSDEDTQEGNFGLGYRRMIDDRGILGVYGYYDVQSTANDNLFHQATIGTEWLTSNWELRLNTYIPLSDEELLGYSNLSNFRLDLSPSRVAVTADATALYEEPLWGADVEVGYTWRLEDFGFDAYGMENWELRALAGAFYFHGDHSGTFAGPMARVEANWRDPFGLRGWTFSMGVEGRSGNGDADEFYLTAGLSIPLGRMIGGSDKPAAAKGSLASRMLVPVRRDVDVLTRVVEVDESVSGNVYNRAGYMIEGANFYSNVASGTGDGTFENPGTLEEAAASGENRLLVGIDAGNGTISTNSVQLMDGQILAGAGQEVTGLRTDATGELVTFNAYPTPTGEAMASQTIMLDISNGHLIELANNNQLNGLSLAGNSLTTDPLPDEGDPGYNYLDDFAQILAAGEGIQNLWVTNNPDTFSDVQGAGLGLFDVTGTVLVEGSTFRDSTYGVVIGADSALPDTILIQNNTFADMDEDGVQLYLNGVASMGSSLRIANNSFSDMGSDAISLDFKDGLSLDATISGNTVDTVEENFLYVDANDSQSLSLTITGNTAMSGSDSAVYVETDGVTTVDVTMSGNTISSFNGGLYLDIDEAETVTVSLTNNTISDTDEEVGLGVVLDDTTTATITMMSNTISGTGDDALGIRAQDTVNLTAVFSNNMITGAGDDGIEFNTDDVDNINLTVASNTIEDTDSEGIYVTIDTADVAKLSLTNNSVMTTDENGIAIYTDDIAALTATITGSTIDDTGSNGIRFGAEGDTVGSVTMSNNMVSNTADDGLDFTIEDDAVITATIASNTVTGADEAGIDLETYDDSSLTATLTGNTVIDTGAAGVDIDMDDDSTMDVTIQSLTTSQTEGAAISAVLDDDTSLTISVMDSTLDKSGLSADSANGIDLDASGTTGSIDATIADNTIKNVTGIGVHQDGDVTASNDVEADNTYEDVATKTDF